MPKLPISRVPEVQNILDIFKFNLKKSAYESLIKESLASQWGDDYESESGGYVDITIELIVNGRIPYSIDRLLSNSDRTYILSHIDRASLYISYNMFYDYKFSCYCDLSDDTNNPLPVDIEVNLNSSLSPDVIEITYDPAFSNDPRITFWELIKLP